MEGEHEFDETWLEVYFDEYCETCKYRNLTEREFPCSKCLTIPANLFSHQPVHWEEK